MSYDIYLFKPVDGESADETFARICDEAEESGDRPMVPEKEAFKERLADCLIEADPSLERFVYDYAEVARSLGVTEEAARLQMRDIELNSPEDDGVQITIEDDHVAIAVAYWHEDEAAKKVLANVWKHIKTIEKEAGYIAYDPQLGEQLSIDDEQTVFDRYTGVVSIIDSDLSGNAGDRQNTGRRDEKPWWKFW